MVGKISVPIVTSILLILISGCSLQRGPVQDNGMGQDPTSAIDTRVAEIVAATDSAQMALANSVASTLTAMATDTPGPAFAPPITLTPSVSIGLSANAIPTFSLTPQVPTVSVSVQTNCRSGPGSVYDILGIMNVGQNAEVVGQCLQR